MKTKTIILAGIMILTLALCHSFCLAGATQTEPVPGEWEITPHEAEKLPEDAQAAFDKATELEEDVRYTPVSLLATQLVAGTNYCILCQVTPEDPNLGNSWALVYIYADLQGNAEITNVYELYIARHSTPEIPG